MKKTFILLFLLGIVHFSFAQNSTVEKSFSGVQIGLFGTGIYNELRLADKIALRGQFGFSLGIFDGNYDETGFILYPEISFEPKWYYNLEKRVRKNKNIKNNGANFCSLNITYAPDWFVIPHHNNLTIYKTLSIIPTWGFRRNFWDNFNYEFRIGLGYKVSFEKSQYVDNITGVVVDLGFKIGYDF